MASAIEPNQVTSAVDSEAVAPTAQSQETSATSAPLLITNCSECQSAFLPNGKRYICILCDSSLNAQSNQSYQICYKCFDAGAQSSHPFFLDRTHDPVSFQRAGALCSALLSAGGIEIFIKTSL